MISALAILHSCRPQHGPACVSRSIEKARRPKIGEFGPLPSTYDRVGHRGAEKWRHSDAAVGDGDVIAGSPWHRSNGGEAVGGHWPDGDAHRLRFDLADRRQQLPGAP